MKECKQFFDFHLPSQVLQNGKNKFSMKTVEIWCNVLDCVNYCQ